VDICDSPRVDAPCVILSLRGTVLSVRRGDKITRHERWVTVASPDVRERLVEAAFALFEEQGFERTTVDDIAERAGVGRSTVFRTYRTKEDLIFPDHERLLERIRDRLATSTDENGIVAVTEAVRLVLDHYLQEGDRARQRYGLTSTVPSLRNREIASVARYQRLFREFIGRWLGTADETGLMAELMAAAVVAAHNHVLRRWLRGDTVQPFREVDAALDAVIRLFPPPGQEMPEAEDTTVLVFHTSTSMDTVAATLRRHLGDR
jgi:AcrR family transcriptional regulator